MFRDFGNRLGISAELMSFLWHHRMWWLVPVVAVLLILGLLIGFGSASGVGPFIYTLF